MVKINMWGFFGGAAWGWVRGLFGTSNKTETEWGGR